MANTGGSSGDVVIKLRLDTAQAEADLKRFQAGIGAATVATGRMTGGGGYGPGGGGYGGGLNIGGMLSGIGAAGLGATFGGADLARGVGSVVGGLGSVASEAMGLGDFRRKAGVPQAAAKATVDALGIAGNVATEQQTRAMYGFFKDQYGLEASAETRVRGFLGGEVAKSYEDQLHELVGKLLADWPEVKAALVKIGSSVVDSVVNVGSNIASAVK